jgi:hypothetical protein
VDQEGGRSSGHPDVFFYEFDFGHRYSGATLAGSADMDQDFRC